MIIKVPIYVEIESISNDALRSLVDDMGEEFKSILRKEKFLKLRAAYADTVGFEHVAKFKIISKESALDSLRIKK
jgi:hypothetical protein